MLATPVGLGAGGKNLAVDGALERLVGVRGDVVFVVQVCKYWQGR